MVVERHALEQIFQEKLSCLLILARLLVIAYTFTIILVFLFFVPWNTEMQG